MSNHTWRLMTDELPPFDRPYLAYMPSEKPDRQVQVGVDMKVRSANPDREFSRLSIIGGHLAYDMPKVTKWLPLDEIMPNPEED